jgi:hypothetical protein
LSAAMREVNSHWVFFHIHSLFIDFDLDSHCFLWYLKIIDWDLMSLSNFFSIIWTQ